MFILDNIFIIELYIEFVLIMKELVWKLIHFYKSIQLIIIFVSWHFQQ
jgi:hypothetical protein